MNRNMTRQRDQEKKSPFDLIISGALFTLGFGVFWFFNPHLWWPVFPLVFAGVFPLVKGIKKIIDNPASFPKNKKLRESEQGSVNEKMILRIAQVQGGLVTPTQIALNSELSLEAAEKCLDSLVKRGHASMQIRNDGRIDYEFREFLHP